MPYMYGMTTVVLFICREMSVQKYSPRVMMLFRFYLLSTRSIMCCFLRCMLYIHVSLIIDWIGNAALRDVIGHSVVRTVTAQSHE